MTYNLTRFLEAHSVNYENALTQIKDGYKTSHWIWYIFPQIRGLGNSAFDAKYSIVSIGEAKEFYDHPILGQHLREISSELLKHKDKPIKEIMRSDIDVIKLRSSATLFYKATNDDIFKDILDTFFSGRLDYLTLSKIR